MFFFIDIDNTIAGRNILHFSRYCNTLWNLGMSEEQLQKGKISYQTFFSAPELCTFRASLSDEQWQEQLRQAEQAPEVLARQRVLPFALEGVSKLARTSSLTYCTVRRGEQEAVRQATEAWLSTHHFPAPSQVLFCRSLLTKLIHVYRHIQEKQEPVVLIDDLYSPLLEIFRQLAEACHPRYSAEQCEQMVRVLREQMILVAFGAESQASPFPGNVHGLRVLPLSSWEHLDELLPTLHLRRIAP